jgi:enamine deaminase RidA (YjgF/YER057c/UK114 family)
MLVPRGRGGVEEQLAEVLTTQKRLLAGKTEAMQVTSQTLFLREDGHSQACQRLLAEHYRTELPATNLVLQPPCCGAALALESWAIAGQGVTVDYCSPHTVRVSHQDAHWTYCAGIQSASPRAGAYEQTREVLGKMRVELQRVGSGFEQVVRTWLYLGGITEPESDSQRYKELNRARSEFYREIQFHCSPSQPNIPQGIYPASTGIGMGGTGLAAGCIALHTTRRDAFLVALENPQQTPAYAYHPRYSPQSPKFSRAVALVLGNQVTTWLSGTASVVHSLSRHPGDIRKQTEQTIENMEKLISAENFGFHGVKQAGARLSDLAKIRVYLKRAEDFLQCKAVCEKRFGPVPAIYAVADVCRPELLVEIEGVAFSRR